MTTTCEKCSAIVTAHADHVTRANLNMEPATKAALKALTDAVELWGATTFHHHVVDVRQHVDSDACIVLDGLLDEARGACSAIQQAVLELQRSPSTPPPPAAVEELARQVRRLAAATSGSLSARSLAAAAGQERTAAEVAAAGPDERAARALSGEAA